MFSSKCAHTHTPLQPSKGRGREYSRIGQERLLWESDSTSPAQILLSLQHTLGEPIPLVQCIRPALWSPRILPSSGQWAMASK